MFRKLEIFEREGVGRIAISELRLPFRVFSRNPTKIMFSPAFAGAQWYLLDPEKVDADVLTSAENAFEAMAYIRSVQEDTAW